MKLFVDDIRRAPEGWTPCRTNTEAIRLLATGNVEEISLDHDIMVPEYGGNSASAKLVIARMSEETYQPVAYYLALMPRKPVIRFHTGNVYMGQKMAEIIGVPFDYWCVVDTVERVDS